MESPATSRCFNPDTIRWRAPGLRTSESPGAMLTGSVAGIICAMPSINMVSCTCADTATGDDDDASDTAAASLFTIVRYAAVVAAESAGRAHALRTSIGGFVPPELQAHASETVRAIQALLTADSSGRQQDLATSFRARTSREPVPCGQRETNSPDAPSRTCQATTILRGTQRFPTPA